MRLALLAVLATGCMVCRPPEPTPVPPGVESAAFIDPKESCWEIHLIPDEAKVVATLLIDVLSLTLGKDGGGAWEAR